MSIEALAMAGVDYVRCQLDVIVSDAGEIEEWLPNFPNEVELKNERNSSLSEHVARDEEPMKKFLVAWAKAVASGNASSPLLSSNTLHDHV